MPVARRAERARRAALSLVASAALLTGAAKATDRVQSAPIVGLRADIAALMVRGVSGGALPLAVRAATGDVAP